MYGNKYLYNLVCNENMNIKKLIIKSNIKKYYFWIHWKRRKIYFQP